MFDKLKVLVIAILLSLFFWWCIVTGFRTWAS